MAKENLSEKELLELIDQAAKDGATNLDLSDRGLTSLPPQIGRLTNLETLYLSRNKLTSLPAEIGQLTNLTVILRGQKSFKIFQIFVDG